MGIIKTRCLNFLFHGFQGRVSYWRIYIRIQGREASCKGGERGAGREGKGKGEGEEKGGRWGEGERSFIEM